MIECLLQRDELEYSIDEDANPYVAAYVAAATSRWDNPEVTAMFADTLRRQSLLYATKINFLSETSFKVDLQAIADAKPEDFVYLQKHSTLGQAYGMHKHDREGTLVFFDMKCKVVLSSDIERLVKDLVDLLSEIVCFRHNTIVGRWFAQESEGIEALVDDHCSGTAD